MTTTKTYKEAGVDIDAGAELVRRIKPFAQRTVRRGSNAELGGFGAVFDLNLAGFKDPLLVASTDGVGTKLAVAIAAGRHRTVGIDLVAMCVNDLIVQGAEPLMFLDYLATAKLDLDVAEHVIEGIADGCLAAGCALAGGETAEMPGMYQTGDYDLAGFSVGAVERDAVLTGDAVAAGDTVLGLASSGLHSNGFSLVRRIVAEQKLAYQNPAPFDSAKSLAEALLEPTRIYVKSCLAAIREGSVHALSHITGGGLTENLPRSLPAGLCADIDAANWQAAPVFKWLSTTANIPAAEMIRTFNCGIGMVAIVPPERTRKVTEIFEQHGETVYKIGQIRERAASDAAVMVSGPAGLLGASAPWSAYTLSGKG